MADRSVIVTGGAGFLGRQTIKPLVERGFTVHVLTRTVSEAFTKEISQIFERGLNVPVKIHPADLHNTDSVTGLIKRIKATHFLHTAWDTWPGEFWNAPSNLDWIVTSKLMLQAFIEAGGERFVGVGTSAEYDWDGGDLLLTEGTTKLLPATIFGQSKLAFRKSLVTISQHHGVSSAWGRVFIPFGPHDKPQRFFASAIASMVRGEEFLVSSGDQLRDLCDVRDIASAFVALLDSQVTGDLNIASGEARTVASVLIQIGDLLRKRELVKLGARARAAGEPQRLIASVERLRREVKWKPERSFDRRLEETVQWWKAALSHPA